MLRPIVDDSRMLSTHPMHRRSSVFMMTASCAIPLHTLRSPVSFQYMYASEDFVPAPSACMHAQYSSSPVRRSGTTLQNAFGKSPLSTFAIAAWTSSLSAETPRAMYRPFGSVVAASAGASAEDDARVASVAARRRVVVVVVVVVVARAALDSTEPTAVAARVVAEEVIAAAAMTRGAGVDARERSGACVERDVRWGATSGGMGRARVRVARRGGGGISA